MAEFGARAADSRLERLVLVEFPGDPLACRYNGTSTDVLTGAKVQILLDCSAMYESSSPAILLPAGTTVQILTRLLA
jgi:hypothetical protein